MDDGGIDEATEFRVGDDSDDGLLQVDGESDFPEIVEPINEHILNNLMIEVTDDLIEDIAHDAIGNDNDRLRSVETGLCCMVL